MDNLTYSERMLPAEIAPALQSALWASVGGLFLAAAGPLTCYMTYFLALPIGGWGSWKAWQLQEATEPGSDERKLAQIALVGGLMSALISAFYAFIMLMVVGVYAAMFVFVIIAGAAGSM